MDKNLRWAFISSALAFALLFLVFTGTTYAWFSDKSASETIVITTGNADIELLDENGKEIDSLVIESGDSSKLYPGAGISFKGFSVKNTGNIDLTFKVLADFTEVSIKDKSQKSITITPTDIFKISAGNEEASVTEDEYLLYESKEALKPQEKTSIGNILLNIEKNIGNAFSEGLVSGIKIKVVANQTTEQ